MLVASTLGCGSHAHPPPAGDLTGSGSGSGSGGGLGGSGGPNPGLTCAKATTYVYTVTAQKDLMRFDPPSHSFEMVGALSCDDPTTPYSMAVDRSGIAWVVYVDGKLFKVKTTDASCEATTFAPGQSGFQNFGMGFSSDMSGSTAETLFVSSPTGQLATIDRATLSLSVVGSYDKTKARAELTGTGDGRLFGAFEGAPYVVSEIDKPTAKILSMAPQTPINFPPNGSNFAFAFWGGDFWLFVGPGGRTDVFQYQPSSGATTKISSEAFEVVGAGVSTCAPTVPPK